MRLRISFSPPVPLDDATLLLHFGRLVMEAMPKFVLVENVPGITKVNGFSTYRRFLRLLEDCGYSFTGAMLNAKNFGVPQNRRRLVLIAMLGGEPSLPEETHGNGLAEFETVRDTISDYPPLEAGEASSDIPNHVAAAMSELNIERIRATDHDGGDRRSWPDNLRLKCHSGDYSGFSDTYGRMRWDSPAPTLTGRCNSISNGRYGHPEQDRAISLREAAALQTFPDNYTFYGSNKHIALQIGNAVPVKFAEVLGTQITAMTNSADNRSELRKQNCRLRPC
jgi:DNA (cytosine-5)-methyltransferase 1